METGARILIVDDNPAVRLAHQRMIERLGYSVRLAASPAEGLAACADWTPDVILLDLLMPAQSGFEAVKLFKQNPATARAQLVAFSGIASEDEIARFRQLGFDEILPKPVTAAELGQRLERLLRPRESR